MSGAIHLPSPSNERSHSRGLFLDLERTREGGGWKGMVLQRLHVALLHYATVRPRGR